jgi:hypothetical protein
MKRQQQIGRHQRASKSKRDMKRLQNRAERRESKRRPEDAPRRHRFWGYD